MKLVHDVVELQGKQIRWKGEAAEWRLIGLRPSSGRARAQDVEVQLQRDDELVLTLSLSDFARLHEATALMMGTPAIALPVPPAGPAASRSRAGQPWTSQEDDELSRGFSAGESAAELGLRLDRTRGAIASRLQHLGLIASKEELRRVEAERRTDGLAGSQEPDQASAPDLPGDPPPLPPFPEHEP
jgi:hypothetical protein